MEVEVNVEEDAQGKPTEQLGNENIFQVLKLGDTMKKLQVSSTPFPVSKGFFAKQCFLIVWMFTFQCFPLPFFLYISVTVYFLSWVFI